MLTLIKACEDELIEKKSRFIALAAPAASEQQALEVIASVRQQHSTATHHVYAYLIAASDNAGEIQRFNDAGEPSGTAGRPVLEVLKRLGLQNVVVVVTRYFGGILLGAGGLTRAYSTAASHVLSKAEMGEAEPAALCQISFDYAFLPVAERLLAGNGCVIREKLFLQEVTLTCLLPLVSKGLVLRRLSEAFGGALHYFMLSERELLIKKI